MRKLSLSFLLLAWGVCGFAAPGVDRAGLRLERARLPMQIESPSRAVRTNPEFLLRVPEHVQPREGCLLVLSLQGSTQGDCAATNVLVRFNGRDMACVVPPQISSQPAPRVSRWGAVIPPDSLLTGWNRVSVSLRPGVEATAPDQEAEVALEDSYFLLVHARLPLFPELFRFPTTYGEEKLLRRNASGDDASEPLVSLLVPSGRRHVHLLACAVIGARLGQLGYLSPADCHVGSMDDLDLAARSQNCILIGRHDELGNLFQQLGAEVAHLDAGQGMLAEFIVGDIPRQRRWLLVTGRDDAGLEKAIRTLGNSQALASAPPNPAVIQDLPGTQATLPQNQPGSGTAGADLGSVRHLLLQDPNLRHLVFLAPLNASTREMHALLELSLYLGGQLPDSEYLWPDACGYGPHTPPPADRLKQRTVLLLGSAPAWQWALPPTALLPIQTVFEAPDILRIQGRRYDVTEFEPSLSFLQMVESPWSPRESLLVAGGLETFATRPVLRLLTRTGLAGTVVASDNMGRMVLYDAQRGSSDSLADRIQQQIPAHLDLAATAQRLRVLEARQQWSQRLNNGLSYALPALLLLLVAARVWFLQDRARSRTRALREEQPLGAAT